MEKSLFQKNSPEKPKPSPYDLIGPEIEHLKKGTSTRHGTKDKKSTMPTWLVVIAFCALAWLYLMDPIFHAWYKGEAARTYLYLHSYGAGTQIDRLVATQILTSEDLSNLNHRAGDFHEYYKSPQTANDKAEEIILYMNNVQLLHAGKYQGLDPVGRMRYMLFIRTGLILPTDWPFLDPTISE